MELQYHYSESTVHPDEIAFDTEHVRLTRNVKEELRENDDDVIIFYTYEEAVLTYREFQVYANLALVAPLNHAMKILLGEEE